MAYTDDDDDYKYEKDDDYYDDDDDDYRLGDDDDDDESLSKPSSSASGSRFGVQPFSGTRPSSPSSGGLPGGASRFGGSSPSGGASPSSGSSPFSRTGTGSLGSGSSPSGSSPSGSSGSSSFGGASRFGGSSPSGGTPSGGSPSGGSGFNRPGTGSLGSSPSGSSSSSSNTPNRFGGSSPSGGTPSGGSPVGGSSGFNRPGTGSLGSGSSGSSSAGGSGSSSFGNTPRFGSSPSSSGGSPSSPSGGTPAGGQPRFGAQSASSSPASPSGPPKPADKKDEKPADKPASAGGGMLGSFGARFGGGAKTDDKKDDKKPADKPASAGGGMLGGFGARFGGGAKTDDKKDDKKPADKPASGGFASRLPFGGGAKTDDKKDDKKPADKPASAGGGMLGGLTSRLPFGGGAKTDDKKDDKKPPTSVGGMFNRGGASAPATPTASASSVTPASTGAKPPATPFGAKPTTPATDTKSAKSASAPAPSGGGLSRFTSFLRRGQPEQKPPARAKATASKAPTVSNNEGLTLDNWLDIIGVSLVFGAMVLLFSAGSSEQAAIGGLLNFVGELLGWGAMAVPVTMLAIGMWLIVRHFGENAPTIDPIRVVGVVLAFVALLILFQYIDSLSYPSNMPIGLLELRLQQAWDIEKAGGGAVGAALYYFLIRNVTEIGGIFVVGFVFLVAGMLITRSSASDMLTQGVGVARNTRANLQQRAINQRAQRQLKAQQVADQKAQNAPVPAPVAESIVPALGQVAMVSAAVVASGDNREIRFNRGGENLAQPQATPQPALASAQTAPSVAPAPNFAVASVPPQPTASGGIFGRIRGNTAPNAPIAPPPTSMPAPNAPATANGGIFGRFARPNNAPEPIAPPLVNPLPLDDDIPSPQSTPPSYTPQPVLTPTPSVADLMRPTTQPITPSPTSAPSFSASSAVSGTGDPSAQPFSRMMSPYERTASPNSPTPTATPSPVTSTPMPATPTPATNGFGNAGNKFPSAFDDDDDDDLLRDDFDDDFDDFDEDDDDEAYTPSRPAPSTVANPLADRNDRLNSLRSGNTSVPSTPAPVPSIIQPMQPSAPLYNPSAPTFGGMQQPAATMPTSDGTFGTKQPSIFGEGGSVTPPSQLPSAQPNNQPSQQSLSVPFSGAVINQTRASRPQWKMPDFRTLLSSGSEQEFDRELLLRQAKTIEDTLNSFGSPGKVVEVNTGPVITQFGVEPDYVSARGKKQRVKVGAIAALDKDLQLALGARSIRVEAPVPGKGYVGVEVPNKEPATVRLRDVMESPSFLKHKSPLGIALGQSVSGAPISADLASMPHLLIAGTTGSGKSVCVNAIITSILARNAPDVVKFIMVDPKRVELTGYNGIPHLVAPVVVELERIVGVLKWVTREMDDRYKKFSDAGARNIEDYNKHIDLNTTERMPYIIVIIDELADLMMLAPEETEKTITRIAALARATGIHLVIATQRPSVDVVTGLIKANFPARIAFAVAGGVDSRVILDQPGAERLLGRGDMLYLSGDSPAPLRLQGVYVSDMEIQNLVRYWKVQAVGQPELRPLTSLSPSVAVDEPAKEIMPRGERVKQQAFWDASVRANAESLPNERSGESLSEEILTGDDGSEDEMYEQAVELVRRLDKASVSLLQRRLRIGYTRAARLIDVMEARGVIGPAKDGSSKPRDVIPQK
jgi:DNA segregation ATPase FtsK/SpoIIIE-like protein